MSHLPQGAWTSARLRDLAILAAFTLPWLAVLSITALPLSRGTYAGLLAMAVLTLAGVAWRRWNRRDAHWLVRTLNQQRPDMEDSADLLLEGGAGNSLALMQRQRLRQRLAARPADLRAAWPWRALGMSFALALLVAALAMYGPTRNVITAAHESGARTESVRLVSHTLHIQPPAYTGLPARSEPALSAKVPQGSMLRWSLRFSPQPAGAALVLLDGQRIELRRDGGQWSTQMHLDASVLYRIEFDGATATGETHRLDAIADLPPQIRVVAPDHTLSLLAPGQRHWDVAFEASDDHGLAGKATLRITLAQGSGENITVHARSVTLPGQGDARHQSFSHRLDPAALGMAEGDDLIVQLALSDNRSPQPQEARSTSLILRWPAATVVEATGIEGLARRVLPAYFRSQRQIILDAEALQKQRRGMAAGQFQQRSDAIGVDQRILRLRYGQFLGEEDTAQQELQHEQEHEQSGGEVDLVEEFGHTHDIAEAATLLDPQTRAVLKQALDQMWQSELGLRQGHPERALPFAYKALEFIKRVQQADRIYLARVGTNLAPVDEGRRLGGKRDGLTSRPDVLQSSTVDDAIIAQLWEALGTEAADGAPDLAPLQTWLGTPGALVPDRLGLQAAIDQVQRQPRCTACRRELGALLWPLLGRPPAAVPRRPAADAQGQRYLDAIDAGGRP